jgi:pimeloyl-ACP methyl ester carboxylesterase
MKLTVNGIDAYAYTGGKSLDPTLPCLVFLHGALHDHSDWTLLARWFAHHGHGVLAVDLPGHARSAGAPLPDMQALAAWTIALLDAAGLPSATLVGHSMGSLIGLAAAALAPERVEHLFMLGTAYPMKVSDALLATARDEPLKAIDMVNTFSHSTWAAKPSYPGPGSWLHGAERALMRRVQASQKGLNLFEHDFQICDRYGDGLQAATKVKCACTMILGKRDQMTAPKQAKELAAALKAQILMVDAGHSMMSEAPEQVLSAMRQVLRI